MMALVINVEIVSLKKPTHVFSEPYLAVLRNASKVIARKDEVKLK